MTNHSVIRESHWLRELLHVGIGAGMLDAVFLAGKAVALELQSPAPAARVGCDVKPAAVEARHPLLPIVCQESIKESLGMG